MHFAVDRDYDCEQRLDHLQLDLVIAFVGALTDALHDCVYQQPRKPAVLLGRLGVLGIGAIVLAVAIEELIGEQFLDSVKQELHQARNLGLKRQFEDVKVFVGVEVLIVGLLSHLVLRDLAQIKQLLILLARKRF
jgi:hypothetical protein